MHVYMLSALSGNNVSLAPSSVVLTPDAVGTRLIDAGVARPATDAEVAVATERGELMAWNDDQEPPAPAAKRRAK